MKLQVSNTNVPTWRDITVNTHLPERLKPLETLARNLWWVWNSEAKSLFHDLDPDMWRITGENPVMLLQRLGSDRLAQIIADEDLMKRLDSAYASFREYMDTPMRSDIPSVAYFSMEYGLCNACLLYTSPSPRDTR